MEAPRISGAPEEPQPHLRASPRPSRTCRARLHPRSRRRLGAARRAPSPCPAESQLPRAEKHHAGASRAPLGAPTSSLFPAAAAPTTPQTCASKSPASGCAATRRESGTTPPAPPASWNPPRVSRPNPVPCRFRRSSGGKQVQERPPDGADGRRERQRDASASPAGEGASHGPASELLPPPRGARVSAARKPCYKPPSRRLWSVSFPAKYGPLAPSVFSPLWSDMVPIPLLLRDPRM